jgi:hypothetical protein
VAFGPLVIHQAYCLTPPTGLRSHGGDARARISWGGKCGDGVGDGDEIADDDIDGSQTMHVV